MKLKCVKNFEKYWIFFGYDDTKHLTLGKEYITRPSVTNSDFVRVFGDDSQWHIAKLDQFVPADQP